MKHKKLLTAASLILLLAASVFLKWMITETVIYHSWPGWKDPMGFEKLNYIIDAAIVVIVYSLLEKHVRAWTAKSALALVHSAVYLTVLMSCNYGWGLLAWREIWDIPYFEYVKNQLKYYFDHASPGFHWIFIAILAVCIGISIFRRKKQLRVDAPSDKDVVQEISESDNTAADEVLPVNAEREDMFFESVRQSLMTDAAGDDVYYVKNHFRPESAEQSNEALMFSGNFKKLENIRNMILSSEGFLKDYLDEDDLKGIVYWSIDKHRLVNGEFVKIFSVHQHGADDLFGIIFDTAEIEHYTEEELAILRELRKIKDSRFSNSLQSTTGEV